MKSTFKRGKFGYTDPWHNVSSLLIGQIIIPQIIIAESPNLSMPIVLNLRLSQKKSIFRKEFSSFPEVGYQAL